MKSRRNENYLERIPSHADRLPWRVEENGRVTLIIAHTGLMHKLTQLCLHKPPVTYVGLDELGSFVWLHINGQKNLLTLGSEVSSQFGQTAEPLYERLASYIQMLVQCRFLTWNETLSVSSRSAF